MVGDNIKKQIKNKMSQEEIAARMKKEVETALKKPINKKYTQSTISIMLKDEKNINVTELRAFAKILGITEADLLG